MWFSIEYPTMDGGYPVMGYPLKRRPQRYTIPSGFFYTKTVEPQTFVSRKVEIH